jgi:hypothetical protein
VAQAVLQLLPWLLLPLPVAQAVLQLLPWRLPPAAAQAVLQLLPPQAQAPVASRPRWRPRSALQHLGLGRGNLRCGTSRLSALLRPP